jgi:hypothetical protein
VTQKNCRIEGSRADKCNKSSKCQVWQQDIRGLSYCKTQSVSSNAITYYLLMKLFLINWLTLPILSKGDTHSYTYMYRHIYKLNWKGNFSRKTERSFSNYELPEASTSFFFCIPNTFFPIYFLP